MSTLNQLNTIDESLFTDLTAEQSSIVEGGNTLRIVGVECAKAGADTTGPDDLYIKFNGNKVWGTYDMKKGYYRPIDKRYDFENQASINLFDSDTIFDDPCGNFFVSGLTDGVTYADVSGSGSKYRVFYEVTAA